MIFTRVLRPLLALCLALLVLAPSALGAPVTERSSLGEVTAELSYDRDEDELSVTNARLRITRAGRTLLDEAVGPPCPGCPVRPAGFPPETSSIAVRRLDLNPEPEVVLDLYSGGAHCCTYSTIFRYDAAGDRYTRIRRNWRDAGYRLRDLDDDGRLEFHSNDARFAAAFTPYALSLLPTQIFRYRSGRLTDVTRRFRAQVALDVRSARRIMGRLRRDGDDIRGALAAYVAGKHLLGQGAAGWRVANAALRRGDLDRRDQVAAYPSGSAYLRSLRRALDRWGYR